MLLWHLGGFAPTYNLIEDTSGNYIRTTSTQIVLTNETNTTTLNCTGISSGGDIIPSVDISFNLGSPTQRWAGAYIGTNTLDILGVIGGNPATIGSDVNGFVYTQYGFASPLINIGASILSPVGGGWKYYSDTSNNSVITQLDTSGNPISQTTTQVNYQIYNKVFDSTYTSYTIPDDASEFVVEWGGRGNITLLVTLPQPRNQPITILNYAPAPNLILQIQGAFGEELYYNGTAFQPYIIPSYTANTFYYGNLDHAIFVK